MEFTINKLGGIYDRRQIEKDLEANLTKVLLEIASRMIRERVELGEIPNIKQIGITYFTGEAAPPLESTQAEVGIPQEVKVRGWDPQSQPPDDKPFLL